MMLRWKSFVLCLTVVLGARQALAQVDGSLVPRRAMPRRSAPAQFIPSVVPQAAVAGATATSATADSPRASNVVRVSAMQSVSAETKKEPTRARVSKGDGKLPNEQGQVWREYDISPYTLRVASTNKPEQSIIDWILRETGYEAWHGEVASVLHADGRSLSVYHTPEMQSLVGDIVDRFVNSGAETQAFNVRVVTVGHPNWRAKAHRMLRATPTQSQGTQAWILEKEDAALLIAELSRRTDFREHGSPEMLVQNGQSATIASLRPHSYTRDVIVHPERWPAFEPEVAQFDEGFTLEFTPLLSFDGSTIDATVKCNLDQLEKLVPTVIEIPMANAPRQRTKIETPQVSHCRLHERFRWPAGKVLLIDCGVVATPAAAESPLKLSLPLASGPSRANFLLVIESRGAAETVAPAGADAADIRQAATFRQRY